MINHAILNPAIASTVAKLNELFGAAPAVAVVLGSGWAGAVSLVQDAKHLSYAELPAFPQPKVEGHVNEIVVGTIGAQRVVMLRGRAHTYESGECTGMAGALRSLKGWGVQVLLQTNASGSLRSHMAPGSLMLISDHINAPQRSPLVGEPGSERFVDMSTVPETILARHAGLRVMGLALMTNMAAGLSAEALTHALTLQQAQLSGERAASFLGAVVAGLAELPSLQAGA